MSLQSEIEALYANPPAEYRPEHRELFQDFKRALNAGEIRAAEPDETAPAGWRVNGWVKQGILLGFRLGAMVDMSIDAGKQPWFDKATYPVRTLGVDDGVRVVPGGSSIRDGCRLGRGVTCMPPMYINVDGTMIDSHALGGSCAQVGDRCHISAAAQIGGVLEPVGALPVVIEDDVLLGGNTGVYEGTIVRKRAVLGSGVILNRSTPLYDLVNGTVHTATGDLPLIVPEGAVVVAGARGVTRGKGPEWGLSLYTPVIVKYRDASTDTRAQLEDWLR